MNSYFSHDSNARNSDKILQLRMKLGAEGYGTYFMILERLRDEPSYMSVKDYNVLAFDFRVSSCLVKKVVEDFDLFCFTDDRKQFYSESFMKRMAQKDAKSQKRKDAANARWKKYKDDANVLHLHADMCASKEKENEEKENKEEEREEDHRIGLVESVDKIHEDIIQCEVEWLEILCMHNRVTMDSLRSLLTEFVCVLKQYEKNRKTRSDFKIHFVSWLRKELNNGRKRVASRKSPITAQSDFTQKSYTGGF